MSDYLAVTRRPDGADLTPNLSHYTCLMKDLFTLLREDGELWDDLVDVVAGDTPTPDRHLPARPAPEDLLAERIVESLRPESLELWLQQAATVRLRDDLTIAVVPAQPERRAS